ncbi:MAG: phytoene desaturase family protein, partial [Gemmatimonadota bacterium]
MSRLDAVIVGAGPNGLAAAVALARRGRTVLVREAAPSIGGGARSAELTLPGFVHDICSAVHPLALSSPFFRELGLERAIDWIQPPAPLAHPFDDGTAALLERSLAETAAGLGADRRAYERLIGPIAARWHELTPDLLAPLRPPRRPLAMARFGLRALRPALGLARSRFRGERARALFTG